MASEGAEREGLEQRADRSERWTSSRLPPDCQGSDRCSVSGPLSSGQGKLCVYSCVCALAQCAIMTGERFIAPHQSDQCLSTPGLDSFQLMYYWRSITVHCLLTGLDWAGHSFTELHRTKLGSPESDQRRSTAFHQSRAKGASSPFSDYTF